MNDHAHASLVQREAWATPICHYIFIFFTLVDMHLGIYLSKYARSLSVKILSNNQQ